MTALTSTIHDDAWREFADDPLPGWCARRMSAFDAPCLSLETPPAFVDTAICSVAFDATASSRVGARGGPRAIREATLAYSSQLASRGPVRLRNMRTGRLHDIARADVADYGDLHVYSSDPRRQVSATAAEVFRVASHAGRTVVIGGEHLISYPAFAAVRAAGLAAGRRTGFVQVDHHFDFGRHSALHGSFYHGSNARRISELPDMPMTAMGFVGQGDLTSAEQLDHLMDAGAAVRSMRDVERRGFDTCLHEVLSDLSHGCDQIYVSIDIDVCDASAAPGTGHVTVGGVSATELLALPAVLHAYPVAGLDIVEVNPTLDPAGTTAHLAARLLFEWLFLRESPMSTATAEPHAAAARSTVA